MTRLKKKQDVRFYKIETEKTRKHKSLTYKLRVVSYLGKKNNFYTKELLYFYFEIQHMKQLLFPHLLATITCDWLILILVTKQTREQPRDDLQSVEEKKTATLMNFY